MDEWQELIFRRWLVMPDNLLWYFGGKSCTKAEVLEHIKQKDEIYDIISRCEREFFDALKNGELERFVRENG